MILLKRGPHLGGDPLLWGEGGKKPTPKAPNPRPCKLLFKSILIVLT